MAYQYSSAKQGLTQSADASAAFHPEGLSGVKATQSRFTAGVSAAAGHNVGPAGASHSAPSSGSIVDNWVRKPNQVHSKQAHFQIPNGLPVFLRGKNDLMIYRGLMGASALGICVVLVGLGSMALNVGKKNK
ncbi:hypothetical protein CAOG_02971 [Capsaspora owczarzaki ATCC 30864]|uniref:Uncharacterized protein n=1 Tax=Capsaspora owczarzaki (strain ATCC 30864) TaxID=595528 RepID=A0A0D2WM95_CAPO3|nr:hypothetical protein CAOG_02971 [Capsaspora owczarzaki ATCC 30864]KJE91910.1 hypothetical protein CAOG_002971 [Capsaspora owczarzaki ATCC 30864]|eukprot:XP_004363810.1 hypothetical protein CAOG_02971 [Capsaspora owczarzaki ATCC 30864]